MHFRVHAYRTATQHRTEVSKEDERQLDWTSTGERSGEDSAEREQETAGTRRSNSAPTEADSRAKQEPGGPAATKTESAAGPVAHQREKRDEKRACSGTIDESISTTPPQRKRVRTYKKDYHPISSHMSRSPTHGTFTSSFLTTTTLLFPAPSFDNPTTPLVARRHTHEFPRIFASPTASGSSALLLGRAIEARWVRRNSRW